jgi:glycolate oxidase FAD binding subunit
VAPDWTLCRDQQLPWFLELGERDLWRLSLPQTTPVLDLPEPPLVEWHGGLRWVRATPDDGPSLREVAALAGGHATLFIADGARQAKAGGRFDALKPPLDRIHRQLKKEFDPAGIFNRGRLYPDF